MAVITGHGGTGVATADNCLSLGLELPELSTDTLSRLRAILPSAGTALGNPTDTGVASLINPVLYGETIKIVAEDDNIDMILVNTSPVHACIQSIVHAAKCITKPLAVSVFALPELSPGEYEFLFEHGIPAYPDPKRAAYALWRMAEYAEFLLSSGS